MSKCHKQISPEEQELIKYLYLDKKYSGAMIAEELHKTQHTIFRWLKTLNILRSHSEARRLGFKVGRVAPIRHWVGKCREESPRWKGGMQRQDGYIMILLPTTDPFYSMVNKKGYVMQHRYEMAKYIKRPLNIDEIVHHVNGSRSDNRLTNLRLLPRSNHSAHIILKEAQKRIRELESQLSQQVLI